MKFKTKVFLIAALFMFPATVLQAQKAAVKTNLLYAGYTFTPNLGIELGLGDRTTLDIGGGYNPWNLEGSEESNKKLVHWLGEIEYRYWLCEKFNGHYFGVHALGSQYNIAEHELPLLFGKTTTEPPYNSKNHRFEGWAAGGGISYGYHFLLGKNWNLETNLGFGYVYLQYDKYGCNKCDQIESSPSRSYIGPTKLTLSLLYTF